MTFVTFMTFVTHRNVIFDILEPPAFRKYGTCRAEFENVTDMTDISVYLKELGSWGKKFGKVFPKKKRVILEISTRFFKFL